MKRSTSWILFLFVLATVLAPRDTAAQSDRAGDDKTLSPFFFVNHRLPSLLTTQGRTFWIDSPKVKFHSAISRSRSSASRSIARPVRAVTRADLP